MVMLYYLRLLHSRQERGTETLLLVVKEDASCYNVNSLTQQENGVASRRPSVLQPQRIEFCTTT